MLEKALRHQMPNKSGEPAAAPAEIQLDPDSLVLSSRETTDADIPVKDERLRSATTRISHVQPRSNAEKCTHTCLWPSTGEMLGKGGARPPGGGGGGRSI